MIKLRNRHWLLRALCGLVSLYFLAQVVAAVVHHGIRNKWGGWLSADQDFGYFVAVCVYLVLIALLFAFFALAPNRKRRPKA